MKMISTKSEAPNSIDYIVRSNPAPVRKLLYDCGYEAPKELKMLVEATKQLVRKDGSAIISELLQHHPDKKAILAVDKKLQKKKSSCHSCNNDGYREEDNFCGACGHSNYNGSGDEDSFLDQFSEMSDTALKSYYDRIVKKSNANPENQKLASEVQLLWNEIRGRKEEAKKETKELPEPLTNQWFQKEELLLLGIVFIAGYLVGNARSGRMIAA